MHGDFAYDLIDPPDLAQASQNITSLMFSRETLNPTVSKSSDPCIICGKVNRNVEINSKKPRLLATFCQEHVYDRLGAAKK
jgi:hypothetical protein